MKGVHLKSGFTTDSSLKLIIIIFLYMISDVWYLHWNLTISNWHRVRPYLRGSTNDFFILGALAWNFWLKKKMSHQLHYTSIMFFFVILLFLLMLIVFIIFYAKTQYFYHKFFTLICFPKNLLEIIFSNRRSNNSQLT